MKKTNKLTLIAILGALAFILTLFKIPFPGTTWLKFDLSEVVVVYGLFVGGPVVGLSIAVLKAVLGFVIEGSSTGGVGEAVTILSAIAFAFPVYYLYNISKKIVLSLIAGTISLTLILTYVNYIFITPFYAKLFKMDYIINMINSGDNTYLNYILITYGPFNLLKGIVLTGVYLIIHKRLLETYKKK
ncbi:MAG: ECF transporter S component [Psychrilyobacter sp.]|nr:ECF transporter S component [Psychrilyobacter sp.]